MKQELDTLHKCSHPHIMQVTELMEDANFYYIASEYLEGGELFDKLQEVARFTEHDAANIIE